MSMSDVRAGWLSWEKKSTSKFYNLRDENIVAAGRYT